MATQSSSKEHIGYLLVEVDAPPRSETRLERARARAGCAICNILHVPAAVAKMVASVFDDPHPSGCSICRAIIEFNPENWQLHIALPTDAAVPDALEVTVLVVTGSEHSRFVPDPAAVSLLLKQRTADWYLPHAFGASAVVPSEVKLDFDFSLAGQTSERTRIAKILA